APGASTHRIPRGSLNFQDLYLIGDRPEADFSGLGVRALPEGYVDHCTLTPPDRLDLSGWVVDRGTGRPVREVQLQIDGEVLQICRLFSPRHDVAEKLFPNHQRAPPPLRCPLPLPPPP